MEDHRLSNEIFDRMTIVVGGLWFAAIVALSLLLKV